MMTENNPLQETIVTPETAGSEQTSVINGFALSQEIERKGREESFTEPHALAAVLDAIQTIGREGLERKLGYGALVEYFRNKQKNGLYEFAEPETLAQEVLEIDDRLIAPLEKQLKEQLGEKYEADKISQTINSLREALLSPILGGKLTAEKIISKINGGIFFKKKPGDEIGEGEFDPEKIAAYFLINGGKATVYFYETLLKEKPEAQALHIRHELAHILAETGSIWEQKIYQNFIAAAQNPTSEAIASFSNYPELQEILKAINAPDTAKGVFRGYIKNCFKAIEENPDETAKRRLRGELAREMVAEMIAAYLENGNSPEAFLNSRLRFANCNISEYCQEKTGLAFDDLCRKYEITPENFNMSEFLEKFSEVPELSPLFRANKFWFEKLSRTFANRGEAITDGIPSELKTEYLDEFFGIDDFEISTPIISKDNISPNIGGTGRTKNLFEIIWNFLTGQK